MPHFLSTLIARPGTDCRLQNGTTGLTMASRVETAFDSKSRKQGLLQRDGIDPESAIVLAPCAAIHTLFMRFPIDVIFVARDGTVAKVCSRVKPWRTAIALGAFAAIELAAGTAAASRTSIGDQLRVEFLP